MNTLREHRTASDHFGDFILALFGALKNWVAHLTTSLPDDEDDSTVMTLRPHRERQALSSSKKGKPRILDAREDRANRRSLRNLLI